MTGLRHQQEMRNEGPKFIQQRISHAAVFRALGEISPDRPEASVPSPFASPVVYCRDQAKDNDKSQKVFGEKHQDRPWRMSGFSFQGSLPGGSSAENPGAPSSSGPSAGYHLFDDGSAAMGCFGIAQFSYSNASSRSSCQEGRDLQERDLPVPIVRPQPQLHDVRLIPIAAGDSFQWISFSGRFFFTV